VLDRGIASPPQTVFRVWSRFYDWPALQQAYYRRIHRIVLGALEELPPPRTIVDLGCGTAQLTADISERYPAATVIGADLSHDMLHAGRDRATGHDLVQTNVYALPFATGSVDVVASTISYQWYLEPARALAEIARALRPGGHFVLAVPSSRWFQAAPVRRVVEASTANLTRMVPPTTHRRDLEAAGFRVVAQHALWPATRVFVSET